MKGDVKTPYEENFSMKDQNLELDMLFEESNEQLESPSVITGSLACGTVRNDRREYCH